MSEFDFVKSCLDIAIKNLKKRGIIQHELIIDFILLENPNGSHVDTSVTYKTEYYRLKNSCFIKSFVISLGDYFISESSFDEKSFFNDYQNILLSIVQAVENQIISFDKVYRNKKIIYLNQHMDNAALI